MIVSKGKKPEIICTNVKHGRGKFRGRILSFPTLYFPHLYY